MHIEFRHLRTIKAIHDAGGLAKAADILHITQSALSHQVKGLEDQDVICRGMAAWALSQLPPDLMDAPALRRLADAGLEEQCELFDGNIVYEKSVSQIARDALEKLAA